MPVLLRCWPLPPCLASSRGVPSEVLSLLARADTLRPFIAAAEFEDDGAFWPFLTERLPPVGIAAVVDEERFPLLGGCGLRTNDLEPSAALGGDCAAGRPLV